jgi:hypothetical protein
MALDDSFTAWLLSLQTFHKLDLMRMTLVEKRPQHFTQLLDVYTKASITQGGISTDTLMWAFGPDLCDPNFYTNGERFTQQNTPATRR